MAVLNVRCSISTGWVYISGIPTCIFTSSKGRTSKDTGYEQPSITHFFFPYWTLASVVDVTVVDNARTDDIRLNLQIVYVAFASSEVSYHKRLTEGWHQIMHRLELGAGAIRVLSVLRILIFFYLKTTIRVLYQPGV